MKPRPILFWILAIIITVSSAVYQRLTGPTYPISGKIVFNENQIKYSLKRTHGGESDHQVQIITNDPDISGLVIWKRYKTQDEWTTIQMHYEGGQLSAELPHQPPAGKLIYQVILKHGEKSFTLPEEESAIIRFKGDVPAAILAIHVFAMFFGMLLSTRAGIESFVKEPNFKKLAVWTLGLIAVGGMILGPIVQKYAFGAFWTGWPFGTDLTDNKTAVMFVFWIIATVSVFKSKNPKWWVLAAAIVTLIVYLIPHSLLGSELDYSKLPRQ